MLSLLVLFDFVGFVFVGDGLVVLFVGWLDWEVVIDAISELEKIGGALRNTAPVYWFDILGVGQMLPNRNRSPNQEICFVCWCTSHDSCLITYRGGI